MREVTGAPGAPWDRELRGRLDVLTVESDILADNPLGDPARRPLYVYVPPEAVGAAPGTLPAVYVIQGYTGALTMWLDRGPWSPNMIERLDDHFAEGDTPPGIVVFVDAWTRLGGSQFVNSTSTGRYMDHLCDEVVSFIDSRYPSVPEASHRGIAGKSSGGYGAMYVPMKRPDVFSALATHAGDALFEVCYLPEFREAVRSLRDRYEGSYGVFFEAFEKRERFDYKLHGTLLEFYAMAACYSPDPDRPGEALLPFDVVTGRLIPEIWEQWLTFDPVRMAPLHADALAGMRHIHVEAGRSDEYFLDLGAQAFSNELEKLGVEHSFELFEGTHGNLQYRYPRAIGDMLRTLSKG
ncbi:MAG: enterochelin esterase [Actinobacteria bacterium]|nr:enterochelin esterase [Actinomycetota bacterium]